MTAGNTAASTKRGKLLNPVVRAFLSAIIAAMSGQRNHTQHQRRPTCDESELDQRVRECGEW